MNSGTDEPLYKYPWNYDNLQDNEKIEKKSYFKLTKNLHQIELPKFTPYKTIK
jgi:hypothetical protein